MGGTVFTLFFWSDHSDDKGLKLCSLAAQGLWMRMLCVAADHEPIGFVAVGKRKLELADIATLGGVELAQAEALLGELERNRVFSRDRKEGCIFSRRMVRDAQRSAKNRKNGKKGGNPSLLKDEGKPQPDKPPDKTGLKPQEPEAINQRETGTLVRDSVPRGSAASEAERAERKRRWETRIFDELVRQHGPTEALRFEGAYQRGEPDARRLYETIDQLLKKRRNRGKAE